jgi:small-conductance mechanosensitive channel
VIAFFRGSPQAPCRARSLLNLIAVCSEHRLLDAFRPRLTLLGVPLHDWLVAAGIALLALLVAALVKRVLLRRVAPLAERTSSDLDDLLVRLLRRTLWPLVAIPALTLGSEALALPARAHTALRTATVLALLLQAAVWGSAGIDFWVERTRRRQLGGDGSSAALLGVLRFVGKVVLWSLLLLVALDNLGIDVTTLVAGLGVGGVAVALATQNILGDLFASLSIALDKPFVIGETIGVGDFVGTVENIGLKTTRLRSVSGEQLIFANGDLLQSRLRNLTRMTERRVVLAFGVAHATPPAALAGIPELLRGLVEAQAPVRFERAHFKGFGSASLDFEAVYWVLSLDYAKFMDVQQAVLLGLLEGLKEKGIELAAPVPAVVVVPPAGGMAVTPRPSAGQREPRGPAATPD